MNVVLVIPAYNEALTLRTLLPQAITQGFYRIYVIDDHSTDDTIAVCRSFKDVEVLAGERNIDVIANRNRIIGHDIGDIVCFLDADMQFKTTHMARTVETLFTQYPKSGVIGATILSHDKQQPILFGFERECNPLFFWVDWLRSGRPLPASAFNVPYREVAWVLEGACAIKADFFCAIGGFDEVFKRYQEGPALCKQAILAGYAVAMTNQIQVVHSRSLSVFSKPSHYWKYLRSALTWYHRYAFRKQSDPKLTRQEL